MRHNVICDRCNDGSTLLQADGAERLFAELAFSAFTMRIELCPITRTAIYGLGAHALFELLTITGNYRLTNPSAATTLARFRARRLWLVKEILLWRNI